MNFLAKRRILQVWLVMLTFLFGVLAPTVSRALEYRQGSNSIEICSASGTKLIKLDRDSQPEPSSPLSGMDHCLYCTAHSHPAGVPVTTAPVLPLLAGRDIYPALYYDAAVTQLVWSAAYPRAPPART